MSGAIVGLDGTNDLFRVKFKSITTPPTGATATMAVGGNMAWAQDSGASYASMTPDGASDRIPYIVVAD